MAQDAVPAPPPGESLVRMTFGEHLEELRRRLLKCIVILAICIGGCFFVYEPLLEFIIQPHFKAMDLMGRPRSEALLLAGTYTGPFLAVFKLSLIVGVFISSPWIAYQLWAFVGAGLYRRERRLVLFFAVPSFLLFVSGCAFGYWVLVPYGLWGLSQLQNLDFIRPEYLFGDYLDLVMLLTIVMGAMFELPLLMIFFSKVGLIAPSVYSKWRRFAIVMVFIVAAVLTPPDPFTQVIMAAPLLVLYEIGVWGSKWAARKSPERST